MVSKDRVSWTNLLCTHHPQNCFVCNNEEEKTIFETGLSNGGKIKGGPYLTFNSKLNLVCINSKPNGRVCKSKFVRDTVVTGISKTTTSLVQRELGCQKIPNLRNVIHA